MGFEGRRKPPEAVIKAAMAEDPSAHRALSSAGGKASALKRAERIALENAERERREEEQAIFDAEAEHILRRDARAHDKAFPAPEDD